MRTSCTRVAYKISNGMALESFHNFKMVLVTGYYCTRALHILAKSSFIDRCLGTWPSPSYLHTSLCRHHVLKAFFGHTPNLLNPNVSTLRFGMDIISWVDVQELILSYNNKEALFLTIWPMSW